MKPTSKKILVVDNDPIIIRMMHKLLVEHGHIVETAEDGLAALNVLGSFRPDICFIDLVMPNISGDRLCRIIRSIPNLEDLYLVILSGVALENESDLVNVGANACIAKGPFSEISKHILALVDDCTVKPRGMVAPQEDNSLFELKIVEGVYHRTISSELLAHRSHSEAILNALVEGIVELTDDYRIIFVNTAVGRITGIPEEKLLGTRFLDLFDASARAKVEEFLQHEDRLGAPELTTDPLAINDRRITLDVVAVKDNQVLSHVVILNDVTERVEAITALRKSEKKYRDLFETGSDLLVFHDLDGRLIETNLEFKKEYDWPLTDGGQAYLNDLFDDAFETQVRDYLKRVIEKGSDEGILRAKTKDRSERYIEYKNTLVYDENGDPIGVKASGRDITERMLAQRELKILNEELEQRVVERTADLEEARRKAEQASLAKSQFLMNMSHELRTPLNSILSSCDLIVSNQGKSDLTRIEKVIRSSSQELLKTFERILDISNAKDGKLELQMQPFRLDDLLSRLETRFAYKGTQIDLDLTIEIKGEDIPNALIGDETRLTEVFFHLMENAAKFSTGRPQATLTVSATEVTPDRATYHFALKDNGIGIPLDCGEAIFETFSQADTSDTRQFDGVGIGLSICRMLVELMGGDIRAERNAGQGSTFHFSVCFDRQPIRIPFDHQTFNAEKDSRQRGLETDINTDEASVTVDVNQLRPLLKNLAIALEAANPANIDNCLSELKNYHLPQLPQLHDAIDEYEYDKALSILQDIIET